MIELKNIRHNFLKNCDFNVRTHESFGILGAAKSGKSELLKLINLMITPDRGTVIHNAIALNHLSEKQLKEERRKIGMVFQNFNLFQNLNVFENVALPLKAAKAHPALIHSRVHECLRWVGLEMCANQNLADLLPGETQRLAIARAIVHHPEVLLVDEPELKNIQLLHELKLKLNFTLVITTPDVTVAKLLCDRIAILNQGSIEAIISSKVEFNPDSKLEYFRVNPKSRTAFESSIA